MECPALQSHGRLPWQPAPPLGASGSHLINKLRCGQKELSMNYQDNFIVIAEEILRALGALCQKQGQSSNMYFLS